jgi:Bacterial SH3 domain
MIAASLIVAVLAPIGARAQSLPELTHPTVQRAMQDYLTYQGQCWPWMRQIVLETTGRTIGFGYVSGFYEAGAIEVPLSEARQGDIIQIADDQNAGPGVDYPGLHTALVVEAFGDGTFTIIDSNSKWDGVVRLRYNYDPIASANRYVGLEVHAWRIPLDGGGEPATQPSPTPTPSPEPVEVPEAESFSVGDSAVVATDSGCLNLRNAPSLTGVKLDCLAQGSPVVVVSNVIEADGWAWVAVQTGDGQAGWVASQYLSPSAPQPASSETPPPATSIPEPTATPSSTPVADAPATHRVVVPLLSVN